MEWRLGLRLFIMNRNSLTNLDPSAGKFGSRCHDFTISHSVCTLGSAAPFVVRFLRKWSLVHLP